MSPLVALLVLQGDAKTVRREIQSRYDALDRGFRKRDPGVLDGLMTEDFSTVGPEGKPLDRDAARAGFRGLLLGAQEAKWPQRVTALRYDAPDWVATVEGRLTGRLPGADGKRHSTELRSTVEDTWARTPEGWRIRRSRTVTMSIRSDGKPVPHG